MAQADGTILIDTEINADGIVAGSNEIKKAIKNIDSTLMKINDTLNSFKNTFIKYILSASKEIQKLDNSASKAEKTIDDLSNKEIDLKIERAEDQIRDYEGSLRDAAEVSKKSLGYNQDAINFIEDYAKGVNVASSSLDLFKTEIEKSKKELSDLEKKGFYFGDEEYDNAFLKLQKVTQALKDYKKELVSPTPNANIFGLDTLSGKIVDAEIELKKLIEAGKGLGDEQYDKVYRKLALLKDEAKQYAKEISKTPAQVQKEAEALAKKEAQQKAAQAKEEARINALNEKLEQTRAKEVQAIMEANRLKAIGDNAEISRKDIVSLNEELEQLKIRQKDLEKAGLGFGFEEYDKNIQRIEKINSELSDYKKSLISTSDAQSKASSTGKKLSKSLKDTGKSAKSAQFGISKMIGMSVLYSFVFRAISGVMTAMKEGFTNLAQYSSETNSSISMLWSSLERLKNSFATAFAPILNVVAPILSKFIDMISTAASYVSMFFSFLSGKSTYTRAVAVQKDYAASLEDTAQSAQDVADATNEAAKAAEGYLSPIDEINKYTSQNDGSAIGGIGDLGGTGESDQPLFEEVEIPNNFIKSLNNVYKILKKIKDLFKKGFWDGLGDYKPALEDLQNDLKSIGTSLADIFTDSGVQNAAKNFVKTLAYSIGQNVGSFVSIGLTIARNIIGGLEKYLSQNKNRIKKYLVSVFDVGSEILSLFGNFSKTLAEVISKTFGSETAQQITGNVIGIFAEVGMLISSLGLKLMSDIANIILSPFIENKDKITQAILGTLEAIEPFTTGLLIAVQTIADSLTRLYDEHISPLFESIKNGLSTILSAFVDGYNTYLLPILQALGDKFQELMEGPFGEMVLKVEGFIAKLIDALKLLWESVLVPFFTWLAEKFFPIISPAIEAIGKVALEVIEFIIKAIGNIADTLSGIIDFIVGVFTGDWELAWTGIQEIFKGIWDLILNILDTSWEIIKETISGGLKILKTLIQTAWEGIKTVTSTAWEYISNFLVDTWETLKGKVKDAFEFIKEKVNNAWDSIKEKAQTVWERLSTWIPEKVEDIRRAIVEKFENAVERVKEVFSNIVDFIKAPINEAIGLVNGAIGAINNAIGGIESAFSFGPWEIPTPFGTRTIGFRATFPRVGTIPYLASGAVIPPNKEFLAVLGDQKQGTNIEAPLSTIEQAVRNVIGDGGNAQYRIPIYINGRQILEAVVDEGELKRRRSGSNPFALGGA